MCIVNNCWFKTASNLKKNEINYIKKGKLIIINIINNNNNNTFRKKIKQKINK